MVLRDDHSAHAQKCSWRSVPWMAREIVLVSSPAWLVRVWNYPVRDLPGRNLGSLPRDTWNRSATVASFPARTQKCPVDTISITF